MEKSTQWKHEALFYTELVLIATGLLYIALDSHTQDCIYTDTLTGKSITDSTTLATCPQQKIILKDGIRQIHLESPTPTNEPSRKTQSVTIFNHRGIPSQRPITATHVF